MQSKRVFVFGGFNGKRSISSVESLQAAMGLKWREVLFKGSEFLKCYHLTAIEHKGCILLFGGEFYFN